MVDSEVKVLIVDDSAFIRKLIKGILEEEGFRIVGEATDGIEAINLTKKFKPEIITLDITMPNMDGSDALSEILKCNSNSNIIMCSAVGQKAKVNQALKAGAKDFIVKPFQKERVLEAVRNVLNY